LITKLKSEYANKTSIHNSDWKQILTSNSRVKRVCSSLTFRCGVHNPPEILSPSISEAKNRHGLHRDRTTDVARQHDEGKPKAIHPRFILPSPAERTEVLRPKIVTSPIIPIDLNVWNRKSLHPPHGRKIWHQWSHIFRFYITQLWYKRIFHCFQSFCESQRFPLDILKVGLSPEIPIEIDQNVKIQKTPWLILLIEVSFKASPPHRRETNQDCTIIWYKKSM